MTFKFCYFRVSFFDKKRSVENGKKNENESNENADDVTVLAWQISGEEGGQN